MNAETTELQDVIVSGLAFDAFQMVCGPEALLFGKLIKLYSIISDLELLASLCQCFLERQHFTHTVPPPIIPGS